MNRIWAYTIQLGFNMWRDEYSVPENNGPFQCQSTGHYQKELLCDRAVWRRVVDALPFFGVNTLVIDLGEGLQYQSHPELATCGAWTREELQLELEHIRALGMEPVPMLNFSAYHDAWLGVYSAQKGSDTYYAVVRDLIEEVAALFGNPSLFHIGMNEDDCNTKMPERSWWHDTYRRTDSTPRTEEEYWKDVHYLISCVEKIGARTWVWGDRFAISPERFAVEMPQSAVISLSWYDRIVLDVNGSYPKRRIYEDMKALHALGYDQIPVGSNWTCHQNMAQTAYFYMEHDLLDAHLLGFAVFPQQATVNLNYYTLMDNAQRLSSSRKMLENTPNL